MNISIKKGHIFGTVRVPGSKSHTIRALILAALSEGQCSITNPLKGADALSTLQAIQLFGSQVSETNDTWLIQGAGSKFNLPYDIVNVGNSGSALYFLAPVAATTNGYSVFTGDSSIRKRPILHLLDLLQQGGAEAFLTIPKAKSAPFIIKGSIKAGFYKTDGRLSQYITGLMIAATRLNGETHIELTDPKETPYLTMTEYWLKKAGVATTISNDFKHIHVHGPQKINPFNETIPSDWEAVAFPLIATLIAGGSLTITDIDISGTQGDDAIVPILQSVGADIYVNTDTKTLLVRGGEQSRRTEPQFQKGRLCGSQRINCSPFPDAVCALAVIAAFIEGETILEDIEICRQKETDRIAVMRQELSRLGVDIQEKNNCLVINGHSPLTEQGNANPNFCIKGGTVSSFDDHRVAMSLTCFGLGLPANESLIVQDVECASISFPNFIETMNNIGAHLQIL